MQKLVKKSPPGHIVHKREEFNIFKSQMGREDYGVDKGGRGRLGIGKKMVTHDCCPKMRIQCHGTQ